MLMTMITMMTMMMLMTMMTSDVMHCMIFHVGGRVSRPGPADTRGETSTSNSRSS